MEINLGASCNNLVATSTRELEIWEDDKGLENPIHFIVKMHDKEVGSFTLAPMPGCCGVVVSTASYLMRGFQGNYATSRNFHDIKALTARTLGYSRMIATVETSNFPEILGAVKAKWRLNKAFTNRRTGHQLVVMEKEI